MTFEEETIAALREKLAACQECLERWQAAWAGIVLERNRLLERVAALDELVAICEYILQRDTLAGTRTRLRETVAKAKSESEA